MQEKKAAFANAIPQLYETLGVILDYWQKLWCQSFSNRMQS